MTCVQASNQQSTESVTLPQSKPLLQQNPFTTYRDPDTGRWIVVKSETAKAS
jgi:hypothetical protein